MLQVYVDYYEQGYNVNYFMVLGVMFCNLFLLDVYEGWSDVFGCVNIDVFNQ